MGQNITEKQQKVLETIYQNIKESGFPPTIADLKEKLGVVSNQSVLNFLNVLERNGYIKREDGQARGIKILPLGFRILGKDQLVPVVGISATGPFIASFDNAFSNWLTLPGQVLANEKVKQAGDKLFAIQVHGDSMINAGIMDGDILLIKEEKEFRSGDIVVARNDDGTTIKKFIAENGRAYLKPENPAYKNIPIFEDTYFDGKVIANLSAVSRLNQ